MSGINMIYTDNYSYLPDLLPLEPPENIGRLREDPDEDMLYEEWRERHASDF